MKITNIHVHLIYFSLTLFFITNIIVANRKTNYNDLRTVSLNKTNCSYLINRTHIIVLSVVLRQQRGYLFLHTFSYFHSWDLQLVGFFRSGQTKDYKNGICYSPLGTHRLGERTVWFARIRIIL
jgi:hypothetical protein